MTFDSTFTSNSHSNNTGLPKKIVVGGAIALLLGVASYYSNGVSNGVALEDQSSVPTAADGVKEVDATAWLTGGDASDFFGIVDSSITIPAVDDPTPYDIIEVVDDGGPSIESCTPFVAPKPRTCIGSKNKFATICYEDCNAQCSHGALQTTCLRLCRNACYNAAENHGGTDMGPPSLAVVRRRPSKCNPACNLLCVNHLLLPGHCGGGSTFGIKHPDITCNKDEVYFDCNFNRNCWARYATGWTCGRTADPVF